MLFLCNLSVNYLKSASGIPTIDMSGSLSTRLSNNSKMDKKGFSETESPMVMVRWLSDLWSVYHRLDDDDWHLSARGKGINVLSTSDNIFANDHLLIVRIVVRIATLDGRQTACTTIFSASKAGRQLPRWGPDRNIPGAKRQVDHSTNMESIVEPANLGTETQFTN